MDKTAKGRKGLDNLKSLILGINELIDCTQAGDNGLEILSIDYGSDEYDLAVEAQIEISVGLLAIRAVFPGYDGHCRVYYTVSTSLDGGDTWSLVGGEHPSLSRAWNCAMDQIILRVSKELDDFIRFEYFGEPHDMSGAGLRERAEELLDSKLHNKFVKNT